MSTMSGPAVVTEGEPGQQRRHEQQDRVDPGDPGQAPQGDPLGAGWSLLETRELVE